MQGATVGFVGRSEPNSECIVRIVVASSLALNPRKGQLNGTFDCFYCPHLQRACLEPHAAVGRQRRSTHTDLEEMTQVEGGRTDLTSRRQQLMMTVANPSATTVTGPVPWGKVVVHTVLMKL
jgi:hypothetical protein